MINKSNRRVLKFSFNGYNKSIVWFPVKELMAVGNEWITSRFKRNIKYNSYLVLYRPYQGTKKGKHIASSTKWGLGDDVVLWLMECLTPAVSFDIFMDNYFTSFCLFVCLPTLELTIFEQEVCSTKTGYANALSSGTNSCEKRNNAVLNNAAHVKQKGCVTCVAG